MTKRSSHNTTITSGNRAVVGIDVGKRRHAAVAVSPQGAILARLNSFPNTRKGVDRLEEKVLQPAGGPEGVLFAMEATGHYWMCLYHELVRRGYRGVVLNPVQTHAGLRSQIRKTSTDRIDALGIARLVLSGRARATRVPDEETLELRLLTRHRRRLLQARTGMECYAHTLLERVFPEFEGVFSQPFLPSVRALIREVSLAPGEIAARGDEVRAVLKRASRGRLATAKIEQLLQRARDSIGSRRAERLATGQLRSIFAFLEMVEGQVAEIERELKRRIDEEGSPLLSMGISAVQAAVIHAETDPITDFPGPQQYVAYAGLDPSVRESGETVRGRSKLSKRGSPQLRHALYLAAFSLYRRHNCFHRLYRKQRRRGRSHTDALNVVAHRLARVVWRLLTDNRDFTKRPPRKRR